AFNLNVLEVINRELDGNFRAERFVHDARYNPADSRIEMRLVSRARQSVTLSRCGATFSFSSGEPLLTEISRKFTVPRLCALLVDAGFEVDWLRTSPDPSFALLLVTRRSC
ncbi:MAG: L-histidine N(alpha)-methyltransferase, partial [Acidiferrobacteraceae bacterium]